MSKFILGIIVLSFSLSYLTGIIFPYILGFNPIEPLIFIGVYLLIKSSNNFEEVFLETLRNKYFVFAFIYSFLMLILGLIVTDVFTAVYADFRSNVILFFLLFFFTSKTWVINEKVKVIIALIWGLTIFDLLAMILRPYMGDYEFGKLIKNNISTILPSFLLIYYVYHGKVKYALLLFTILGYEVIFSFMRNVYLIAAIAMILVFFTVLQNIFTQNKNKFISIALLTIFTIVSFSYYGDVYNYWKSDPSRDVQSIRRSEEFLENVNSETVRINSFLIPFVDMGKVIIPKGLGAREHIEKAKKLFNNKVLSTNDSSFLYLAYHYGVIFCFVFTFFFLVKPSIVFLNYLSQHKFYIFSICLGLYLFICVVYFSQSILLTFIPAASAYSLIYAIIMNPKGFFKY